ncbi:MAG: hypothetical protein ACRD3E_13935 [Terriglobales bacterium]
MHEGGISIWFFIGICLLVMGALIFGTGIYELVSPPPVQNRVVLYSLHAPIWWGAVLFALGGFYSLHFRPRHDDARH